MCREVCYNTGRLSNPNEDWMRRTLMLGTCAVALAASMAAACGDSTEPIKIPLPEDPTEVMLSDLVTGSLLDPSGFDMVSRTIVRTDQVSGWDFVFFVDPQQGASLRTRGSYLQEEDSEPGVQVVTESFEDLTTAPEDGYEVLDPVRISTGDVFAARSRYDPALGGLRCRYYGKFEVEAIDEVAGSMTMIHLINPNCEDRNLDPSTNP